MEPSGWVITAFLMKEIGASVENILGLWMLIEVEYSAFSTWP